MMMVNIKGKTNFPQKSQNNDFESTKLKTMEDLKNAVAKAIDNKTPLGVFIEMPNFPMPELITNPIVNLKKKLSYWEKTYNENLEHKYAKGVKIVGCTIDFYINMFLREGEKE